MSYRSLSRRHVDISSDVDLDPCLCEVFFELLYMLNESGHPADQVK